MILMNESVISFLIIIFAQTARGSFGNSLGCNCFEYCKKFAANVQKMFLDKINVWVLLSAPSFCQFSW